ncbi:MAG: cell division protein FtsB [Planctomycetota bacterium]|jgi:cell division protein FtsB
MKRRINIWPKHSPFSHPVITLLLVVIIVVVSLTFLDLQEKLERAKVVRMERQEQLGRLEADHDDIKERLDKLQTPYGVEYELRDKYRVVKEGEGVVVLLSEQDEEGEAVAVVGISGGEVSRVGIFMSKIRFLLSELIGSRKKEADQE